MSYYSVIFAFLTKKRKHFIKRAQQFQRFAIERMSIYLLRSAKPMPTTDPRKTEPSTERAIIHSIEKKLLPKVTMLLSRLERYLDDGSVTPPLLERHA